MIILVKIIQIFKNYNAKIIKLCYQLDYQAKSTKRLEVL